MISATTETSETLENESANITHIYTHYISLYTTFCISMHYLMRKFYSERDCFRTSETRYSILANTYGGSRVGGSVSSGVGRYHT